MEAQIKRSNEKVTSGIVENKKIEALYDLGGLRSKEDILELRRIVVGSLLQYRPS